MITVKRPPWMRDALCAEYPQEWWYVERGRQAREAKDVCRRCLVQRECLAFAMANLEKYGIWAGLNYHERLQIQRRRWDNPCKVCGGRIPMEDVIALTLAGVERRRWCCGPCREAQVEALRAAS